MAKFIEILELVPEETKGNKEEKEVYIPVEHICMIKKNKKTKIVSIYLSDRSSVETKEDISQLLGRIKHA